MQTLATKPAARKPAHDFPPAPCKPDRSCRLHHWNPTTGKGGLSITEKGKQSDYVFESIPSEVGGEGWLMLKISEPCQDVYAVLLAADGFDQCDCRGHERWKHCRHVACLKALKAAG